MKQGIKSLTLPAMVVTLMIFSCNEVSTLNEGSDLIAEGLILYTGEIAADGCGYMIQIGGQQYKPLNLPEKFEINGLKVRVKYEITQQGYQCTMNPSNIETTINLTQVKLN